MRARVAELADAPDLGSGVFGHRGSNPLSRTIKTEKEQAQMRIPANKTATFLREKCEYFKRSVKKPFLPTKLFSSFFQFSA